MTPHRSLVLGWKPTSHGFAWVAFETPFSIYDWGQSDARGEKNARCLALLDRLLDRLQPELVVLEAFEGPGARQSPRVKRLCRGAVSLARDRGIDVTWLSRADVRAGFAPIGARSRFEIASAVARSFESLGELLPPKRRVWEAPPRRMAVFDAAAVVVAHYQLGASNLFDELKNKTRDSEE